MPNDDSTAGPAGAARAVANAKSALAESHKHFGDNPDYAPNQYAAPRQARKAKAEPTTIDELNAKMKNVKQYRDTQGPLE